MWTQRRLCRRRSHTRVCHMFKTMVHRRSSTCCQGYGTRYWTGSPSILQVHGSYPMAHLWGYEPRRSWRSHRVFLTGEDRSVSLVRAFLMRGRVWSAGVPKDTWQIVAQMARVRARCLGAEIELEACQRAAQLLCASTLPRCRDSRHGDMSKEARTWEAWQRMREGACESSVPQRREASWTCGGMSMDCAAGAGESWRLGGRG